jgi:hypothetical protein
MRHDAEAVGPEEDRAAALIRVCGVDPGASCAAVRGFFVSPGCRNQHDGFDRIGGDDLVDQTVDGISAGRDDQEIELGPSARPSLFDAVIRIHPAG